MKLGDLFIKLGLKSQEFEQGIGKAKGTMSGFASLAKTVGGVVAAAFSVRAIVNFFTTSAQMANLQIEAENRLAAAIRANGKDVENTMSRYKNFAAQIQRTTVIGDDMTLSMLQLAESLRSKAPEEAARMAIGLSKALGMDLNTATRAAVLAQNGNTIALSRYIPELRGAGTEAEKLAAIQRTVNSGMEIATSETETLAGKVKQLKNTWGDLREEIGKVIVENTTLLETVTDLNTAVQMLSTKKFGITSFLSFLAGGKSWEADKKRFEEFQKLQQGASRDIDAFAKSLEDAAKKSVPATEKLGRTLRDIEEDTAQLKEQLKDYTEFQTAEIHATLRQIEANEKLIKSLTELKKAREKPAEMTAIDSQRFKFEGTLTAREKYAGFMQDVPQPDNKQLANMEHFLRKNAEMTQKYTAELMADWDQFNLDFNRVVVDGIADTIITLADAFGQLFTGQISGKQFFNQILGEIGAFASKLGAMMIAFGVAQLAFGNSLKNIWNPAMAPILIGAGAALVAIGGAIRTTASSRAGGGAGASGGGMGMYNQSFNVSMATPGGNPRAFLRGDDIYISQERNLFKRGAIG